MNNFNEIAKNVSVGLAQIKTVSGDLRGNTNRILDGLNKAIEQNVDIVVFPELAITGYNCGILFTQQHFIDYNLKFLHKVIAPRVPKNMVAIIGFVDCIGKKFDGNPNIQNSLAIIQDGYVIGKYSKILLANGGHHDDKHYFTPGNYANVTPVKIQGKNINLGTVICEDTWNMDHSRDIVKESIQNGAELIITINQSYFYYGKQEKRKKMYKSHASKNSIYVISANNIGVGDTGKNIMLYDGGSVVINPYGEVVNEAKQFSEDFVVAHLSSTIHREKKTTKYEEIYNALVFAQKQIFQDMGFEKAQVHISGGLDSSVTLPILVDAMGAENVIAITNPSKYNSDTTKSNAQQLCDALGVKLWWEPIGDIQEAFIKTHKSAFGNDALQPLNISTFDAVGRTVLGIAASQHFKTGLVSTSNHTEIVLNWFSWHDISTAATYGPLSDMTKVEIFQLAEYINQKFGKEIIPVNLFDGTTEPGPELADAAHAKWDYFVVSGICAMLIRERKDILEIIQAYKYKELSPDFFPRNSKGQDVYDLVPDIQEFERIVRMCFNRQKASVYKAAQSCPPLMISPLSRGFSNREPIINKYEGEYDFESILEKEPV